MQLPGCEILFSMNRPDHSKRPAALSPAQMAARLPASARQSVEQWPFADMPLEADSAPEQADPALLRRAGTLLARVTGLVYPSPDFVEELQLRVDGSEPNRPLWLALRVPDDPRRYTQLAGLMMDVSVELLPTIKDVESWRDGTLQAVHGIQMPLRPGDPQGVARGIVQSVHRSPFNDESYGMRLWAGGGHVLSIGWNPSRSVPLHRAGILECDSVVAMQVQQKSGPNYLSHASSGSYHLLESPNLIE